MLPHTKGTWEAFIRGDTIAVVKRVAKAGGRLFEIIHWSGFDQSDAPASERAGNALIAAASLDMLKALEGIGCCCGEGERPYRFHTPRCRAGFRAAAKARGRRVQHG